MVVCLLHEVSPVLNAELKIFYDELQDDAGGLETMADETVEFDAVHLDVTVRHTATWTPSRLMSVTFSFTYPTGLLCRGHAIALMNISGVGQLRPQVVADGLAYRRDSIPWQWVNHGVFPFIEPCVEALLAERADAA